MEWKPVGPENMLADGTMSEVKVGNATILLARVEGNYYAVQALCPHQKAHLARGKLGGFIATCPGHKSQFDLRDGHNLVWLPKLPPLARRMAEALKKPEGLRTYRTKVEGGQVWVEID